MNVYGPNNDNQAVQFYDHLIDLLRKEGLAYEDKIIIGGDFNCPINPLLDKQGGILVARKKLLIGLKNYRQYLIYMMFGV